MILKTPFGYIDLLHTWEGWTLIGAVVLFLAALVWWMEWGKVKCWYSCCQRGVVYFGGYAGSIDCPVCHGTGRVRRRWISRLWRRK